MDANLYMRIYWWKLSFDDLHLNSSFFIESWGIMSMLAKDEFLQGKNISAP